MSLFEFACIIIAATICAFWSWCMLRTASDADEWWEERERETDALLAECERWLEANR